MRNTPALLLLTGLVACRTADAPVISIGESVWHDDFVYSVRRVNRMNGSSRLNRANPENQLWLVVFQVENQAKRVAPSWSDRTACVTDSAGSRHESLTYALAKPKLTPAGKSDSTTLLFSLPRTLTRPYLQVRGEALRGDIRDGRYEKTRAACSDHRLNV